MNITEVTIIPHLFIVWLLLRSCPVCISRGPVPYFVIFAYLTLVHERYVKAFQNRLESANERQSSYQREIGRQRNERRVRSVRHDLFVALSLLWFLSALNYRHSVVYFIFFLHLYLVLADSEILRWLNYVIEKLWPLCMEEYASKRILQPIVDCFLEKHKPLTSKKALVQCLCLGSNPPMFTELNVFRNTDDNERLVIEVGLNYFAKDHMRSIVAVKLRDRLGLGMWVKLDMTNLYIDGKVVITVKFLSHWPFVRHLQVCFVEPPHFRVAVKPLFTRGLDVMEPPGIVRWLDELLSVTLKKLPVLLCAFKSGAKLLRIPLLDNTESYLFLDVKEPVAHVRVGVIKASGLKPPLFLGSVDWYVKVRLGNCTFRSRTQRTQSPRWDEEYKIPVAAWGGFDKIIVEVCYKGFLVDKTYGGSSLDIKAVRDEGTHFRRLPLRNNKRDYLHLSVAVLKSDEDCHLPYEAWFSVDEVKSVGYANVEVIGACDLKGSTSPGSIDAYLIGKMGPYQFRTKAQYKTEAWLEKFTVPIHTLREPNILSMEVRDERHSRDNFLGSCVVDINNLVDGQRHDSWLRLDHVKSGRLHIAITVAVSPDKGYDSSSDEEKLEWHDETNDTVQWVSQFPHDGIGNKVWTPRKRIRQVEFNVEDRLPDPISGDVEGGVWTPRKPIRQVEFIVEDRLPDPISGDVEGGETSTSEGEFYDAI